jgi:hypothetical protein
MENYVMLQINRYTTFDLFEIEMLQDVNIDRVNIHERMLDPEVQPEKDFNTDDMTNSQSPRDKPNVETQKTFSPSLFQINLHTPTPSSYSKPFSYGPRTETYLDSFTNMSYISAKDIRPLNKNTFISSTEAQEDGPTISKNHISRGDVLVLTWDKETVDFVFSEGLQAPNSQQLIMTDARGKLRKGGKALWDSFDLMEASDDNKDNHEQHPRKKKNQVPDLYDCIHEFTKEEKLGEEDLW